MLMLLFFLLVGMTEPDPPLQEEIIEIEMEFSSPPMGGSSSSESQESTVTNTVTESAQELETQEESPVYVPSGQGTSTSSQNTEEEQPKPDDAFSLPSNSGNGEGNGEGDNFGNGDGLGGDGPGETPGGGSGTNLNRKVVDKGGITAQSQEEGKVAIDIWVNDKGEVVKTKFNPSKSNSPSSYLIGLATKWAKTMQYQKSLGSPVQFVGYQVFNFTKQ
jgi:hypothetical protein